MDDKLTWKSLFTLLQFPPKKFSSRFLYVASAAVLMGLSFPPYELFVLVLPALTLLYWGMKEVIPGEGMRLGWTFVIFFYPVHTYWFVNFHPLALPAVLVVLGFWYGIWGYCLTYIGVNPWTASASWILLQMVIGTGYLAFPWSRIVTALAVIPSLIQPVRYMGELAWGGSIALGAFLLAELISGSKKYHFDLVLVSLGVFVIWGGSLYGMYSFRENLYPNRVTLVQPNVQSTFGGTSETDQFGTLVKLTRSAKNRGQLIVWPETAVSNFPFEINRNNRLRYRSPFIKGRFQGILNKHEQLFFGLMFRDPKPNKLDYLNGAVIIGSDGSPSGYYTKRRPVPAGEHLPYMGQWEWVRKLGRMLGTMGYRPGRLGGLVPVKLGDRLLKAGVQICFEDAFPGLVRRQVLRGADLLINISNDSWSRSWASHKQHFLRARIRAIEMGTSLLRNGNTGISAIIDPLGRVRQSLPAYVRGTLTGRVVEPMEGTFYRDWGSWITWLFVAGFGILGSIVRT